VLARCEILFATKEVVQQHSKVSHLKMIEENMANCIRIMEQEAAARESRNEKAALPAYLSAHF
jgi:hypothetical protein